MCDQRKCAAENQVFRVGPFAPSAQNRKKKIEIGLPYCIGWVPLLLPSSIVLITYPAELTDPTHPCLPVCLPTKQGQMANG